MPRGFGPTLAGASPQALLEATELEAILAHPVRGNRNPPPGRIQRLAAARTANAGRVEGRLAPSENDRAIWTLLETFDQEVVRALHPGTATQVRSNLLGFAEWHELVHGCAFEIGRLTPSDVVRNLSTEYRLARRRPALASRKAAVLRLATWATEQGIVSSGISQRLERVEIPQSLEDCRPFPRALHREALSIRRRICDAVRSGGIEGHLLAARLILEAGLPVADLVQLERSALGEHRGLDCVAVAARGQRARRTIPLPPDLAQDLRGYLATRRDPFAALIAVPGRGAFRASGPYRCHVDLPRARGNPGDGSVLRARLQLGVHRRGPGRPG